MKKNLKNMLIFIGAFLLYALILGFYFNFYLPVWMVILAILVSTLGLSWLLLKNIFESLILGLLIAEVAWTLFFWPLGYLTIAATLLIIFYLLWDILVSHLNKKRLITDLCFGLICLLILLASTKWLPI